MSFTIDLRYHICMQPIELPIFNSVALELLQLLADPEVEIDDVIETINKDQALSIQILGMANSSAYAGRYRSETIKDSVNRLGVKQITSLAMAASQAAIHTSETPLVKEMMQALWHHSFACALGGRSLAISCGRKDIADQAYIAGLLHDIGKLYLLKAMEQISLVRDNRLELDQETLLDVFSDMHVEQGMRIMDYWEIPPLYHDIVARHHVEHFDPTDTLLAIVRLVNFNSVPYGLNLYPRYIQPQDTAPEMHALQIDEISLAQLEKDMNMAGA